MSVFIEISQLVLVDSGYTHRSLNRYRFGRYALDYTVFNTWLAWENTKQCNAVVIKECRHRRFKAGRSRGYRTQFCFNPFMAYNLMMFHTEDYYRRLSTYHKKTNTLTRHTENTAVQSIQGLVTQTRSAVLYLDQFIQ